MVNEIPPIDAPLTEGVPAMREALSDVDNGVLRRIVTVVQAWDDETHPIGRYLAAREAVAAARGKRQSVRQRLAKEADALLVDADKAWRSDHSLIADAFQAVAMKEVGVAVMDALHGGPKRSGVAMTRHNDGPQRLGKW